MVRGRTMARSPHSQIETGRVATQAFSTIAAVDPFDSAELPSNTFTTYNPETRGMGENEAQEYIDRGE